MPERLPKNSCDTHLHVFGDARTYPVGNPNALYQPPQDCTFAVEGEWGLGQNNQVQPTIYGTDHSLLHDVLKAAPAGEYRGVAIVDDSVSDAELARLHSVGVRGARFNFGGNFKLAPSLDTLRRTLDRVRELGWFVKVFGFNDDFLAVEAVHEDRLSAHRAQGVQLVGCPRRRHDVMAAGHEQRDEPPSDDACRSCH